MTRNQRMSTALLTVLWTFLNFVGFYPLCFMLINGYKYPPDYIFRKPDLKN